MTVTDEINDFIAQNGGNARDALNVALARLTEAKQRIEQLEEDVEEYQRREVITVDPGAEWEAEYYLRGMHR